jgi:hypothetical protein
MALLATGLPWAMEPAGAAMVPRDLSDVGDAIGTLTGAEVATKWESMTQIEWEAMLRTGATKQTQLSSSLGNQIGTIVGTDQDWRGPAGGTLRNSQFGQVAKNPANMTKTYGLPVKSGAAGRVGSLVSKGGKLLGTAGLAWGVFELTYSLGAWAMEPVSGIDSEGFWCDFKKMVNQPGTLCGQTYYEPVDKPDGWEGRKLGGGMIEFGPIKGGGGGAAERDAAAGASVWVSDSGGLLVWDIGDYVLSSIWFDSSHAFASTLPMGDGAMSCGPIEGFGEGCWGMMKGAQGFGRPFEWDPTLWDARLFALGVDSPGLTELFRWHAGGETTLPGVVARVQRGVLFTPGAYDGRGMVYRAQCLTTSGSRHAVETVSGDVEDPQEIGQPGRLACPEGEFLTRMVVEAPDGTTVFEWEATPEEIQEWQSGNLGIKFLSLYKVEDGIRYDCHLYPSKCANWWQETQTDANAQDDYECYYGKTAVELAECRVYQREFIWPRSADEELTHPTTGDPIPRTVGNAVVDPADSTQFRPAPAPETIPVRTPQPETLPDPQPEPVRPDPFEPPPGVTVPPVDPTIPVVPPGGGTGDADTTCPPSLDSWFDAFNPRWIFDGVICALKAMFVPGSGFMAEQVALTRQVGQQHAPMSIALAVPPVVEGLGQGWTGGCEAMPDFSGVNGLKLAMGCAPPDNAGWRVAWSLMTIALWVGAVLALWRMGHNALGGKG